MVGKPAIAASPVGAALHRRGAGLRPTAGSDDHAAVAVCQLHSDGQFARLRIHGVIAGDGNYETLGATLRHLTAGICGSSGQRRAAMSRGFQGLTEAGVPVAEHEPVAV